MRQTATMRQAGNVLRSASRCRIPPLHVTRMLMSGVMNHDSHSGHAPFRYPRAPNVAVQCLCDRPRRRADSAAREIWHRRPRGRHLREHSL